jgi:hypothetical protein
LPLDSVTASEGKERERRARRFRGVVVAALLVLAGRVLGWC